MLLLALLACKDGGPTDTQAPVEGGAQLTLTPAVLDFGEVAVHSAATEVITVENPGDEDLHVFNLELSELDAPFVIGAIESVLVPPGQATTFLVSFAPEILGRQESTLLLSSDAAGTPVAEVRLSGVGTTPASQLYVDPPLIELGPVLLGCSATQTLQVRNIGGQPLRLDEVSVEASSPEWSVDLQLEEHGPLPWRIGAGLSREIAVTYTPEDELQDTQTLRFQANGEEAVANQGATGLMEERVTDSFEVGRADTVDVLIALNTNASMDDDVALVLPALEELVSTIDDWQADTHLALVTADDGCVAGSVPYMRNIWSDAERLDALAEMLTGDTGYNADAPFMLMEAALSPDNLGSGGCNEGFLRDYAGLAMLSISDQDESSINPYSYYVSLFQSYKEDPDLLKMSAVAGDYPEGCGTARAGTGMYEASVATGGFLVSICSETFAGQLQYLESVGDHSSGVFPLRQTPIPSSISVTVGGLEVEQGWSYSEGRNRVVFDNPPRRGSAVDIHYIPRGSCEE